MAQVLFQAGCPSCHPTNSVEELQGLKALTSTREITHKPRSFLIHSHTSEGRGVAGSDTSNLLYSTTLNYLNRAHYTQQLLGFGFMPSSTHYTSF